MTNFKKMMLDQSGAAAAEYALILAIIGSAIALAAFQLGGAIANSMNAAKNCIEAADGTSCT